MISIKRILEFSPNWGVIMLRSALEYSPEEVMGAIKTAYKWLDDDLLIDAYCGGEPFSKKEMTIEEFIELRAQRLIEKNTLKVKRILTNERRRVFNKERPQLALALIESGTRYICSHEHCSVQEKLTVDHIIPLSRGGTDDLSNLAFLCKSHNSKKSDKILNNQFEPVSESRKFPEISGNSRKFPEIPGNSLETMEKG